MVSCSTASSSSDSHTYVSVNVHSLSAGCSFFGLALGSTSGTAAAGLVRTCWDFGVGFASAIFVSGAASVFGFFPDRSAFSSRVLLSFLSSLAALSSASLRLRLRSSSCSNSRWACCNCSGVGFTHVTFRPIWYILSPALVGGPAAFGSCALGVGGGPFAFGSVSCNRSDTPGGLCRRGLNATGPGTLLRALALAWDFAITEAANRCTDDRWRAFVTRWASLVDPVGLVNPCSTCSRNSAPCTCLCNGFLSCSTSLSIVGS